MARSMLSVPPIGIIGVASFLYTFHVLYRLMCFASSHNENHKFLVHGHHEDGEFSFRSLASVLLSDLNLLLSQYCFLIANAETPILRTLRILVTDACLLSFFMLQHTLMAREEVKNIYEKLGIEEIERGVYNAASSAALYFLIDNWQSAPWISLWDIDTSKNDAAWILFVAFHVLGWSVVYSGCLMMDISELAGLKQIYYKFTSRSCPLASKSKELVRYYAHMRHPSFIGFLVVLWIHPRMT